MMHPEIIGGVPLHNLHMEVLTTGPTGIPLHSSKREHHPLHWNLGKFAGRYG